MRAGLRRRVMAQVGVRRRGRAAVTAVRRPRCRRTCGHDVELQGGAGYGEPASLTAMARRRRRPGSPRRGARPWPARCAGRRPGPPATPGGSGGRAARRRARVKASTPIRGSRASRPSIWGSSTALVERLAGWWRVRHHSTEKWTIGTSRKAAMADDGGPLGRDLRVGRHPPEGEVAEVEDEQQRGGGEAGVPRPPHAPRGPAPDRADDRVGRGRPRRSRPRRRR